MRLLPPTIDPQTNRGERLVFEAFRRGAQADMTVLHSLDIADHNRQIAGEIDFLVVAPGLRVLVLEVKGVRHLARRDGVWIYGDGPDARTDARGPFTQASSAMHGLRERLVRGRPHLAGVPFWSAACFPLLDFAESSEEWHSWQVIDRRALAARPLDELVADVRRNGRRRMAERRVRGFDPGAGEPTTAQCDEIVAAARPDFEILESPRSRARRIEEEIRRFTEEQFAALDSMARNPRVVFDGPAGTGKTLLAMEAARRGAAAGRSASCASTAATRRASRSWLAPAWGWTPPTAGCCAPTTARRRRFVAGTTRRRRSSCWRAASRNCARPVSRGGTSPC